MLTQFAGRQGPADRLELAATQAGLVFGAGDGGQGVVVGGERRHRHLFCLVWF